MKICTRCFTKNGSVKMVIDTVIFQKEDTHVDVCADCKNAIEAFINSPAKVKKTGSNK